MADASADPFRALADATRRVIVAELTDRGEQTLYELCVRLVMKHDIDMTRQAVTKHLRVLEEEGFIETHQKGRHKVIVFTGLDHLDTVRDWLDQLRSKDP